jgi:diadenosine tetraphosphate (Ap4A) HIT family hydrolase
VASFFELTAEERVAIFGLLDKAKAAIDLEYAPDAYNIGINDGAAAGQTVMHLHMHLIPRYAGDADDPRGGVRWIFPRKADYWNK